MSKVRATDILSPDHHEWYARCMKHMAKELQTQDPAKILTVVLGLGDFGNQEEIRETFKILSENESDLCGLVARSAQLFLMSHLEALCQAEQNQPPELPRRG